MSRHIYPTLSRWGRNIIFIDALYRAPESTCNEEKSIDTYKLELNSTLHLKEIIAFVDTDSMIA